MRAERLRGPFVAMGVKAAVSALVLLGGFRAVSDDDYARVVIAESWARAPRLDPSGTSWLPLPFWVTGLAERLLGRGLPAATAAALALGVLSVGLVWLSARWLGETDGLDEGPGPALGAAVAAAVLPWSARLGVATVPELPAAALTLLAMASLTTPPAGARRGWGALALLAATLSRYEVWPVAAAFAALCLLDARRPSGEPRPARLRAAACALVALAGPAAWLAWNHREHGDALHFLARVTAYHRALGGQEGSALARLAAYPVAMGRDEPELFAGLALLVAVAAWRARPLLQAAARRHARPFALAGVQLAALSAARVQDGAPTHHPERAVLVALLLGAAFGGDLLVRLLLPGRRASTGERAAIALALGATLLVVALGVRPSLAAEAFAHREDEAGIGALAATRVPPGEKCLIEVATVAGRADYGYLAVTAALGRPEDALPDRTADPRLPQAPSSLDSTAALSGRLAGADLRCLLARLSPVAVAVAGEPIATRGAWALFRLPFAATTTPAPRPSSTAPSPGAR